MSIELVVRFFSKIEQSDGCWVWVGEVLPNGYGRLVYRRKRVLAHRLSYYLHRGAIPAGAQIDHLCRNRTCVRPDHLEAVSPRENVLRGEGLAAQNARATHCKVGHPIDGRKGRQRYCRTCANAVTRQWREKVRNSDDYKRKNRENSRRWRAARTG